MKIINKNILKTNWIITVITIIIFYYNSIQTTGIK